jgi:hypothetical protein
VSENRNVAGITISDFKLYYRAIIAKIAGTNTKTNTDERNRIEDPVKKNNNKNLT